MSESRHPEVWTGLVIELLLVNKNTGQRRAFVQFEEVDHAIAFMKQHYPKLFVELQQSTDGIPEGRFEAYIHYARKREEWDAKRQNNVNWNCPSVCTLLS